ncbi:MAG: glycosyltransferase family 4 protein [Bacteroidetes bacterium]|nr:glycosyltransferase family 4 protein [Bacteroidota bacterium]MBS1756743.1 glycosyltransferase family 4 protein [Bacteroidota bacterium]
MQLRVLILVPGFPKNMDDIKGGVHSAIANLLMGFKTKDIVVRLVSFDRIKERESIRYSNNIEIVYLPEGGMPFHSLNYLVKGPSLLKKQIKEFKPDIIHFEEGNSFLLLKSRGIVNTPYLLTVHGMTFAEGKSQKRIKDKLNLFYNGLLQLFFFPKNIIHISNYSLKMHPPVKKGNTVIISNAISPTFYQLAQRANTSNTLLFIGVMNERKNLLLLLKAIKNLNDKNINFSLNVLGGFSDKDYEEKILTYINQQKLVKQVHFAGWVNQTEVQKYLVNSDILVLPSRQETLPMVIAECMAASTPVVASNVGGIPEMVFSDKTGIVFLNENLDSLCNALEQLYNNDERIVQMGMAANKIAFEKYHCNSIADKTIDFYKKILAE